MLQFFNAVLPLMRKLSTEERFGKQSLCIKKWGLVYGPPDTSKKPFNE